MFKFLTKPKFLKVIAFMLTFVFVVNISGCVTEKDGENGVTSGNQVQNLSIGTGSNVIGYTVYSQSTFDPMTEELFMGYLLSGRDFSLVVVPGSKSDDTYTFDPENALYESVQMGVYEYDEVTAGYVNPDKKYLLYYVTDLELRSWFDKFSNKDNFINQVMSFTSAETNVADQGRYTCKKLVNMGRGLSSTEFCDSIMQPGKGVFSNAKTGGMILFFGYGSIEGYMTYEDILGYQGSQIANSLVDPNPANPYDPSKIRAFNYQTILFEFDGKGNLKYENGQPKLTATGNKLVTAYGWDRVAVEAVANGNSYIETYAEDKQVDRTADIKVDAIEIYSELLLKSKPAGYERTKTTYELLGSALLSEDQYLKECKDYKKTDCKTLTQLSSYFYYKKNLAVTEAYTQEDKDRYVGIYNIINMINSVDSFKQAAFDEAFNIKLSVALTSRYTSVTDYPAAEQLLTGNSYGYIQGFDKDSHKRDQKLSFEQAQNLMEGKGLNGDTAPENADYLVLIASEGFVLDRGTSEDQRVLGYDDMLGEGQLLAELVRMDACPNKTAAGEMYNILANMKIVVGSAMAATGAVVAVGAAIGLSVFSAVMGTLITVGAISASTGYGIIITLAIAVIIGLIFAVIGLVTLFDGLQEKARIKGMGASSENYCDTYAATFNMLFETIKLTIPVYYYRIPAETDSTYNSSLSIHYCPQYYLYNESINKCEREGVKSVSPINIPLYTYADVEQASQLSGLEGSPMLVYFNNGTLVDKVVGASTSYYIVEMLRLWGLLAMREIVYDIKEENGTMAIYHTTNTNSRTHTIKEYRYCYTLEYEQDLYDPDGKDKFCYNINTEDPTTTTGAITKELNLYYYGKYTEKTRRIDDGTIPALSTNADGTNSDSISAYIENSPFYGSYFDNVASSAYKFYKEKLARNVVQHTDTVATPADFVNGEIHFKDAEGNVVSRVSYYQEYTVERKTGYDIFYLVRDGSNIVIYHREDGKFEVTKKVTFAAVNGSTDIEQFNIVDSYKAGVVNIDVTRVDVDGVSYVLEGNKLTLDGLVVGTLSDDKKIAKFNDGREIAVTGDPYTYSSIQIGKTEYQINGQTLTEVGGTKTGTIVDNTIIIGEGIDEVRYVIDSSDEKTIYLSYWSLDFIKYTLGLMSFPGTDSGDALEVVLPIYFTATVKESTQAQAHGMINHGGIHQNNGSCSADEYLYYRENGIWFDNKSKCLKDSKVRSDDYPYEATDENYNVTIYSYTSSVRVGEIIMTLTQDGQTKVTVRWN